MTATKELSEELYLLNCWQFGYWSRLAQIDTQNASQEHIALKASAQLQLGDAQLAKNTLANLTKPTSDQAARLMISGVFNSLGKARAIMGYHQQAEVHFVESVRLPSDKSTPANVYKARVQEQFAQLGLAQPHNTAQTESNQPLGSCKLIQTKNQHFTQDLTLSFWLNIHSWPSKWTNIVSKSKSDEHNEFCLRLKNQHTAQWYYGVDNKTVVLNNLSPKKHIKLNEWTHIALVKRQDQISRLYIDGLIRTTRDIKGLPPASTIMQEIELLGQDQAKCYLDGAISEFRLHSNASNTQQIIQSMQDKQPNTTSTSVHYDYCSSCNQKPGAVECLELLQIQQDKHKIAVSLRGLDYYELINSLKTKRELNFAIIGANDGKTNDPLYDYIVQHSKQSKVMLIEPQQSLIPYLEQNYAFHPKAHIINCAVGDTDKLTLYTVKPEYWPQLNVPYAQSRRWPIYRAPTGVSSSNPQHVADWLKKHLDIPDFSVAIAKNYVPCKTLHSLMQEQSNNETLDVLQVDTEGFDDYVLYNSDLSLTQPKIIHFESVHLSTSKKDALYCYLRQHNYKVFEVEEDSIALTNSHIWQY